MTQISVRPPTVDAIKQETSATYMTDAEGGGDVRGLGARRLNV